MQERGTRKAERMRQNNMTVMNEKFMPGICQDTVSVKSQGMYTSNMNMQNNNGIKNNI